MAFALLWEHLLSALILLPAESSLGGSDGHRTVPGPCPPLPRWGLPSPLRRPLGRVCGWASCPHSAVYTCSPSFLAQHLITWRFVHSFSSPVLSPGLDCRQCLSLRGAGVCKDDGCRWSQPGLCSQRAQRLLEKRRIHDEFCAMAPASPRRAKLIPGPPSSSPPLPRLLTHCSCPRARASPSTRQPQGLCTCQSRSPAALPAAGCLPSSASASGQCTGLTSQCPHCMRVPDLLAENGYPDPPHMPCVPLCFLRGVDPVGITTSCLLTICLPQWTNARLSICPLLYPGF